MVGIAQNEQKRLIFIVVPQFRTKMREKGKREKNRKMDKSKENTLIYMHMYICTHPRTYKHVKIHIHTLREKCPNTELFLVRIFLYSELRIWTLFMQ